MYVCVCKAVKDSAVRACVGEGARSVRDLTRCTGLGTGCGKCVGFARERIRQHTEEQTAELARAG